MSSFCDIFPTEPGCPEYDPDSEIREPDIILDDSDADEISDPEPDTKPEPENPDKPIDNTETTEDVDEETKIEIVYSVASEESPMNRVVRI